MALHRPIDHAMDLDPECKLTYRRIYKIWEVELRTLEVYIEGNPSNGFVQQSS